MERRFNVKLVRTYKYCPKCTGMMNHCNWGVITAVGGTIGGTVLTNSFSSMTSTFNHRCDKCGHGENYDRTYPTLEYIDNGELE